MNETARAIGLIEEAGTSDPFELARFLSLRVEFGRWFPATYGELERRSRTVTVNLAAPVSPARIVAHEIGHFVLGEQASEQACDRFAEAVLEHETFSRS